MYMDLEAQVARAHSQWLDPPEYNDYEPVTIWIAASVQITPDPTLSPDEAVQEAIRRREIDITDLEDIEVTDSGDYDSELGFEYGDDSDRAFEEATGR
jgi:hypothetical protein